ncbi:MAG: HEPN domain-containing protein [Candidatus Aminicenantes bacterium]|nr:HEPN domain-containing protein [Candidatus Aminicenantes bacterium]
MKKEVKNWLDSARYDLETAEHILKAGRYVYTIFMCHLAIEKVLKAKVEEITGKTPPKVHNLRYLAKLSGLGPPEEMLNFLSKLSEVSIPTRYPEDFIQLKRTYTKKLAQDYLRQTKEAFEWIKKSLKP